MKKQIILVAGCWVLLFPLLSRGQYYDSTREVDASAFVDSVAQSVGSSRFHAVSRTHAFWLANTLGEIDRATITPQAFIDHVQEAEEVRTRFYPKISTVNFRYYLLPMRIRAEDCTPTGWRKMLRDQLEPEIKGVSSPEAAAAKVLGWCESKVHLTDDRRCYRLGLKGDLDPMTTLTGGSGSEVDLSILAVAALRSVGVAARLVEIPAIVAESGGKVWVEYRGAQSWVPWVPSAPDEPNGRDYIVRQFWKRIPLVIANPDEPVNITASYVPVAHVDVTLSNLKPQERPGWNLLLAGGDQLYPVTGRDIYMRMAESLDVGAGNYVIVAGDHTICGLKPVTLNAGETASYVLDASKKGSQDVEIDESTSKGVSVGVTEMNAALTHNPDLW